MIMTTLRCPESWTILYVKSGRGSSGTFDRRVLLLPWPQRRVSPTPSRLDKACILLSLDHTAVMKVHSSAHSSTGVSPTYCVTPITKTIPHSLHIWQPRNMGPWRFHIAVPGVEIAVYEPKGCANVYVVGQKQKNTTPNLDRSHLCHCIVLWEQNVKHTKEHAAALLPLPLAFSLGSEWNKAQLLPECLGGKSETDSSIMLLLFPTMEKASHKMSTLKATGPDIVNDGWYWFSSPVICLAYNVSWWYSFTYLKWICESLRLSQLSLALFSASVRAILLAGLVCRKPSK